MTKIYAPKCVLWNYDLSHLDSSVLFTILTHKVKQFHESIVL